MDIQINLERAIHQLVDEFLMEPYRFFTEADAVSRFHHLLESDRTLNERVQSKDGIAVSTIHQGYPTFFRSGDLRGQYDIIILTPGFIRHHNAEAVRNRENTKERTRHIQPFQAVVEFMLDDHSWSSNRSRGAVAEMGKLILSRDEADLRYFIGLRRYTAPSENRWNKYWPDVTQSAMDHLEIRSLFATYRLLASQPPHVQSFGNWIKKYEEQKRPPAVSQADKTRPRVKSAG